MDSAKVKALLNSFGVICATLGAFLVWRFLGELNFADKRAYLEGISVLVVPDPPTDKEREKFRWNIRLSKFGLGLILVGGFAQVVSNHLPG